MASRREILLSNIVERLERIKAPGGTYAYSGKLKSVQRYIRTLGVDWAEVNEWGPRPTVIVREGREASSSETMGTWTNTIQVSIHWVADADSGGSVDLNNAVADMKRALFEDPAAPGFDDQFGVQATVTGISVELEDPRTNMPIDGVMVTLSVDYQDQIGAPDLSG